MNHTNFHMTIEGIQKRLRLNLCNSRLHCEAGGVGKLNVFKAMFATKLVKAVVFYTSWNALHSKY